MANTLIGKLIDRAIETASRMNQQAKEGDVSRNHVNYGALTEICYMLLQIGVLIEDCTYADGVFFKCACIKRDGEKIIDFEK